jgi:hypothetical protein
MYVCMSSYLTVYIYLRPSRARPLPTYLSIDLDGSTMITANAIEHYYCTIIALLLHYYCTSGHQYVLLMR